MKKVAVILHGWPVPVNQSRGLWKYLEWKGYEVIVPKYMEMQDDFSISAVQNLIENALKGQKPDLIMGLSLGGLMLPFIAEKYPKAQLIFVATGCRLAPKVGWFPRLVQAIAGRGGKFGAVLLQHIPDKYMKKGYESVHSVKEHMYDLADYREDEDEVLSFLKKVDPAKHVQVARFVKDCDTKEILPRLPNKTLIISGKKDVLMPLALGEEMHNLLKNSQLLVTEGNHYKVLDKQGFEELDKFLV